MIIHPDVRHALSTHKAVVALESTLISHGLPYPHNRDLALELEDIIRAEGAVPATIAILDGVVHIGLTSDQIDVLATAKDVLKLNAAEIALCIAAKRHGATTVAATMHCAAKAGIRVFATGGLGGVHRDVEESFDISQDLIALARYPVCVVCSGAKSILDLPKTLEYLETQAVPVVGYGIKSFPAFWSRSSGLPLKWIAQNSADAAAFIKEMERDGWPGGLVLANPVPEHDAVPAEAVEQAVAHAMAEASAAGITGGAVTPFMLKSIRESLPATLTANLSLLKANARVGAKVAVSLASL